MPRGEPAPRLPQVDVAVRPLRELPHLLYEDEPVLMRIDDASDPHGLVRARNDAEPGLVVLLRPDQHVCARLRHPTAAELHSALRRALAQDAALEETPTCR